MIRTSKRKRRTSSVCTWSRRSMRPCSASTKRPRSGAESESAVPLHADLFLLVEPGGAVVCQNPARCHYPGRLHLGRRSSAETAEIHSRLRPGRETIPLDLYRSAAANPYLRNHRDSVLEVVACGPTTPSPRIACQTQTRDKRVKQSGTPVLCRMTAQAQRS